MQEFTEQDNSINRRAKEIYNTALSQLMTGAIPVLIFLKEKEAKRISANIIQSNLDKITGDVLVYVFAIDSGSEPSDYLANLYLDKESDTKILCKQHVVRYWELPSLLEKSYKVDTRLQADNKKYKML